MYLFFMVSVDFPFGRGSGWDLLASHRYCRRLLSKELLLLLFFIIVS